jgi:molecular chaperone GrpE (heat shock protein)
MAEQRNFNTGQSCDLGNTGKEFSDIDASETDANKETDLTSPATTFPQAGATTGATSDWQESGSSQGAASSTSAASPSETFQRQKHETIEQGRQFQATARETAADVKRKAAELGRETKAAARDMSDQAMHSAAEAAQQMQQQCATFADGQKSRVASELSTFSEAISRAADKLREDHDDRVASYAEMAASQLRTTANYLESHDVSDLMGDIEHFARRRPEVFFGGMLLAGLGIARFLKASSRPSNRRDYRNEQLPMASMERNRSMATSSASSYDDPSYDELSYAESSYTARPGAGTQSPAGAQSPAGTPRQPMNDPLSYH